VFKRKSFRFQKKYIAFFTIVPVLLMSALIHAPCPVCQGRGSVSSTGMRWVSINDIKATTGGVYLAFCGTYRIYITDISLELQNNGETDANGQLSLILVDYRNGNVLDNQYVGVSVPAKMQTNAVYTVYFQTNVDDPQTVKVTAKVVNGDIPDKVCNGTGKIPMNSWPVYSSTRDRLLKSQEQAVVTPAFMPVFIPPEDWDANSAYDMEVYDDFVGK
jgi:hypothetical protein